MHSTTDIYAKPPLPSIAAAARSMYLFGGTRLAVVLPDRPRLVISSLEAALADESSLVCREALDLLLEHLPIKCGLLSPEERVRLILSVLRLLPLRDWSLSRRAVCWLTSQGGRGTEDFPTTAFAIHAKADLLMAIKTSVSGYPASRTAAVLPLKSLAVFLGDDELEGVAEQLMPDLSVPVLQYILRESKNADWGVSCLQEAQHVFHFKLTPPGVVWRALANTLRRVLQEQLEAEQQRRETAASSDCWLAQQAARQQAAAEAEGVLQLAALFADRIAAPLAAAATSGAADAAVLCDVETLHGFTQLLTLILVGFRELAPTLHQLTLAGRLLQQTAADFTADRRVTQESLQAAAAAAQRPEASEAGDSEEDFAAACSVPAAGGASCTAAQTAASSPELSVCQDAAQPLLQQLLQQLEELLHGLHSFFCHVECLLLELVATEEATTPALDTLFSMLVGFSLLALLRCLRLLDLRVLLWGKGSAHSSPGGSQFVRFLVPLSLSRIASRLWECLGSSSGCTSNEEGVVVDLLLQLNDACLPDRPAVIESVILASLQDSSTNSSKAESIWRFSAFWRHARLQVYRPLGLLLPNAVLQLLGALGDAFPDIRYAARVFVRLALDSAPQLLRPVFDDILTQARQSACMPHEDGGSEGMDWRQWTYNDVSIVDYADLFCVVLLRFISFQLPPAVLAEECLAATSAGMEISCLLSHALVERLHAAVHSEDYAAQSQLLQLLRVVIVHSSQQASGFSPASRNLINSSDSELQQLLRQQLPQSRQASAPAEAAVGSPVAATTADTAALSLERLTPLSSDFGGLLRCLLMAMRAEDFEGAETAVAATAAARDAAIDEATQLSLFLLQ
ncbi:N-terminal domain-containing protein [Cyclospora cayetanensis]|uniref:N-terminal domain-containing protein n=1 Tax=Cyclospora cayetanensis TaxID=88456 RepID=A0A1D3D8F7_9EIME|nr:N-terminal domain-containing protein [Cyclospora cayetanensis]